MTTFPNTPIQHQDGRRIVAGAILLFCSVSLSAGPQGGKVIGGSGSINYSGTLTQIHQASQRMAIDWQSFNVAANERILFVQPSAQSVALNRILDSRASTILGRIDANGKLFLVNPRGIIFGKGAVVNATDVVASDLDIDPDQFMAGEYLFSSDGSVSSGVINQGQIEAAVGGSVTLLGTVIRNEGDIVANQGTIQLVAADEVIISFEAEGNVGLVVNRELLDNASGAENAVYNSGRLSAEGGRVLMAGHMTSDLYTHAVNNEGIVEATSLISAGGYIELIGDSSTVVNSGILDVSGSIAANGGSVSIDAQGVDNSGRIDASGQTGGNVFLKAEGLLVLSGNSEIVATASAGTGGTVEFYGDRVGLLDSTSIDVSGQLGGGTILLGGDYQGGGDYRSQLSLVSNQAELRADALISGDGGKVIVWSDDSTVFKGEIYARGGSESGNGGFVEVSGKQNLQFLGDVDTSAASGEMGTLLLDPTTLRIVDGVSGADDAQVTGDSQILSGDGGAEYVISEAALESLTSNITLEASETIIIENLTDNELCFYCSGGSGTVLFRVPGSVNTATFTMNTGDTIRVNNGNLTIDLRDTDTDGVYITTGDLVASGNINVLATVTGTAPWFGGFTFDPAAISLGDVTSIGGSITISASATSSMGLNTSLNAQGSDATITTGLLSVGGSGNISVDALTDINGGSAIGPTAGDAVINTGGALINGAGTISYSTQSTSSGGFPSFPGAEQINLAGTFSAGTTGNNGFFAVDTNNLNLTGDTVIDMINDGTGSNPIIFTISNTVNGGGNDLTLDVDQGNFGITWSDFSASSVGTLTLGHSNDIFVVDGGAGAGDVTITQAELNQIDGVVSGLALQAQTDIVISDSTLNFTTVNLNAGSAINITGAVSTASGNITANAGTTLTMNPNSSINAGSGTVDLTAAGDMLITALSTTSAGASAVSVTSTGGAILDGDTVDDVDITATSGTVNLSAATGIGDDATATDYTLEINAANVAAANSTANNIDLSLTGNVTLDGSLANSAAGGGLVVDTSGNLIVDSAVSTSNGIVDLTAGNALTMTATGSIDAGGSVIDLSAVNDVTLTSVTTTNATASAVVVTSTGGAILDGDTVDDVDITATSGTVNLSAARGIGDDASATDYTLEINAANVAAANSTSNNIDLALTGNITLDGSLVNSASGGGLLVDATGNLIVDTAVSTINGLIDLNAGNALTMNSGSSIDAGSGAINLAAASDIALTSLTTTNTTASAVAVISTSGAILDGDTVDDVDITAAGIGAVVNLNASTGIGTLVDALDLDTPTIAAATASGDVSLTNASDLTLSSVSTASGAVSVVSSGALTVAVGGVTTGGSANPINLSSSGGNLQLDGAVSTGNGTVALASSQDITINNSVTTSNGDVQMDAADNLSVTASGAVNTGTGAITMTADSGAGDSIGALSIASGGSLSGGNVALSSAQTMNVTGVQGSAVTLISGAAIVDADTAATDITVTNPAGALTLSAATSVGAGDPLETDTRLLVLDNGIPQTLDNIGNVLVSGLVGHSGGNITLSTTGDLSLATSTISDSSLLDLTASGDINIASLNSSGALQASATNLNIGSASVDSLSTATATSVSTTLDSATTLATGDLALAGGAAISSSGALTAGVLTMASSGTGVISSGGDTTLTSVSGSGGNLSLTSAGNITVGSVALGVGNFSAQVDTDANEVATLSLAAITAGDISLSGGADNNDIVQVGGQIVGNNVSTSGLGQLDVQQITAQGVLSLQAATINLSDNLTSRNGLFVVGNTNLLNSVVLDSTGGGAVSGSKLEITGNWNGGGNDLTLGAGSHVVCTEGADISGVGTLTIADSIKTVMGAVSANTIDVRSRQEIHLNESVTAGAATFNADTNNDGVGLLSVLTGKSINAASQTLVGSTTRTVAATPATCDYPVGLPTIAEPEEVDQRLVVEVQREAESAETAVLETFARNASNITYLESSCQPNNRNGRAQQNCSLDESVRRFLGTFLIDFQLPGN